MDDLHQIDFTAELLLLQASKAAWHYVILPEEAAENVKFIADSLYVKAPKRGFNSMRVMVQVGATKWKTSIFPEKEHGSFFLPIKLEARKAESMTLGQHIDFKITLL